MIWDLEPIVERDFSDWEIGGEPATVGDPCQECESGIYRYHREQKQTRDQEYIPSAVLCDRCDHSPE